MPKFNAMSAPEVGSYVAANLTMQHGALKVAFTGSRKSKPPPIHEIASNLLPHSMYLFIHAITNQQKLVDGRKLHVKMDFCKTQYGVVPTFTNPAAKAESEIKKSRATWIEQQALDLGKIKPGDLPLSAQRSKELMRQLYKQKQDELYCMRSVHLDKDGWLPAVAIPPALNAKQQAYADYIASYTELPGNIQEKAKVQGGQMSAYVEYTAGQKDADGEFSEPRWRVVYDWVNDRFFLTWHYQPGFFVRPDKKVLESPWVHIQHVPGSQGLDGPAMAVAQPDASFKDRVIKTRGLEKSSWG
jgi:hypothetical protein